MPKGIQLGLARVQHACSRLDGVHDGLPVVHVAGTNGKGSVAAMTARTLKLAGYRVGCFTSPHLCRFAERIQVDQAPIDDILLTDVLERALATDPELSFFETTFVAAMLAFRHAMVHVAVLEVGLGGRLDATNVVPQPVVTSVTRIARDHTELLGDRLESIAWEKASIAKPGVPMVVGRLDDTSARVVRQTALERGASEVLELGRELVFDASGYEGNVMLPYGMGNVRLRPSLRGVHQLENAGVAAVQCACASRALTRVTLEAIEKGVQSTRWPGRLEWLDDGVGRVLLDAAHNPDGMSTLVAHLRAEREAGCVPGGAATALVFGAMADKAWAEMLDAIAAVAAHRVFVAPGGRKPASVAQMVARVDGQMAVDVRTALSTARSLVGADGVVVVCGSIFLAGEARALLLGLDRDPAIAL
ncbi:MAG: bifunctional folylpolyglutamate synthase/dihydrofolate synthase [Polyangiaceae bacterium]|nr:bifunctional folylpolyglutamate synthase/dihydrofolate synthase [Polyangiaceae bacterium]